MEKYLNIFLNSYSDYASYLWRDITQPTWNSYFYWLILISAFFFFLEIIVPWRKNQKILRKDFWLDFFYMFFNFFLFSLIIYIPISDVVVNLFNDSILSLTSINLKEVNPMYTFPFWAVLIIGFVVRDFVQWWVHRLLHNSEKLWEFHKVHHSVEEMGFAAHLRFHWMERVIYSSLEYLPLALLGLGLYDFFIIHLFTISWGHYNHSNISIDGKITGGIIGLLIGIVIAFGFFEATLLPDDTSLIWKVTLVLVSSFLGTFLLGSKMKYIFNSPEMHIWHHAHDLPENRKTGVNYGLTLAIWDYIFGTNYIPREGRDISLGFEGVEHFPDDFVKQNINGFK